MKLLRRVEAPATNPVTLTEAKAQLGVSGTTYDTLIGALIDAATSYYDGYGGILGRAIVTQTWEMYLDEFPRSGVIMIPLGLVQSITSIRYLAADWDGSEPSEGPETTISAANYYLDDKSEPACIHPVADYDWPDTYDRPNAVIVRFVAGWGDAEDVPAAIRQAILLRVGNLYRGAQRDTSIRSVTLEGVGSIQRGTTSTDMTATTEVEKSLIAPFRRPGP